MKSKQDTISREFVDQLIDFNPGKEKGLESVAKNQRDATVAVFNMLAENKCAYLADEVGMGKTYVALGVMCLLRYFNPKMRVIVIAPRANIQKKWKKEMLNFVDGNWRVVGNRVKSLDSTPVWEPVICESLHEFAHEVLLNQDRDFFLRMTSFSLVSNEWKTRKSHQDRLCELMSQLKKSDFDLSGPISFQNSFGVALNLAFPQADLVIVDEGHNLRHGYGANVSTRNRLMSVIFGRCPGDQYRKDWFEKKAKNILFLSATPFEDDYGSIKRQMGIFGFENQNLLSCSQASPANLKVLDDDKTSPEDRQNVLKNLLIRRTSTLTIGGKDYTKNMYRREWRHGGMSHYDSPIRIDDIATKLVIALVQKKVSEVLNDEKFNNNFQIGMLSSFESFSETLAGKTEQTGPRFDDTEQQRALGDEEKDGIDSDIITSIVQSYSEWFDESLPHPKQDMLIERLKEAFLTCEKSLVFVRRVATVAEIRRRLCLTFDKSVKERFKKMLPDQKPAIDQLFHEYEVEKLEARQVSKSVDDGENGPTQLIDANNSGRDENSVEDLDEGGDGSFFEWYFRGTGPAKYLSGRTMRARFTGSGAYSTVFQDNYLAGLLECEPKLVLREISRKTNIESSKTEKELKRLASNYFSNKWQSQTPENVADVYESYQVAGLLLLAQCEEFKIISNIILREKFQYVETEGPEESNCLRTRKPSRYLSIRTVFSELRKYPDLKRELWPDENENEGSLQKRFRRQEQRRELFARLSLLGLAYIDLYLLAVKQIGSFEKTGDKTRPTPKAGEKLVKSYVKLLQDQAKQSNVEQKTLNAFYELSQVASTFEVLRRVNFPELDHQPLSDLPTYFGRVLGYQEPIGGVSGQTNNRLVAQFRMPGFPLVLISTDVLQEGEDLHTYCKQVIHYGIAWNPSSIEQRTGRVDRIGGLVQRNFGKLEQAPKDREKIQVFYPYLSDTVERIQVEKVLERLNKFVRLIHENISFQFKADSTTNLNKDIHAIRDIKPIEERLYSAFEIDEHWLHGNLKDQDVVLVDVVAKARNRFKCLCESLPPRFDLLVDENFWESSNVKWNDLQLRSNRLGKNKSERNPHQLDKRCTLRVKSHVAGEEMILQCEMNVAELDLEDRRVFWEVEQATHKIDYLRLCVDFRIRRNVDRLFIRNEILFDPDRTKLQDLLLLLDTTFDTRRILMKRLRKVGCVDG